MQRSAHSAHRGSAGGRQIAFLSPRPHRGRPDAPPTPRRCAYSPFKKFAPCQKDVLLCGMNKKMVVMVVMVIGMMVSGVRGNVLYFYGKVDSVTGSNPFLKVGDSVAFTIYYSATNNVITRVTASVDAGVLPLVRQIETPASHVFIDSDPSDGTVQWSVTDSGVFNADAASNTPGGVIPCIDSFDLGKTFQIFFNGVVANGTITALPRSRNGN